MTIDTMLDDLLKREGGYVDAPQDRGGPTKYGITLKTLQSWRGAETSKKDVQNLSKVEACEIYTTIYYKGAQVDKLPSPLQPPMFDACVNHGARQAWRMLQLAMNTLGYAALQVDGVPGENTFNGVKDTCAKHEKELVSEFIRQRRIFYDAICQHDPSQRVFLAGWLTRLEGLA